MRINKFIARATGLSRRAADKLADSGEILINGHPLRAGEEVHDDDVVTHRGQRLQPRQLETVMLNKPAGFVVSRAGQGSKTIYDILPAAYHHLKPIGRLDKDSSGLLLLTNDGTLANELTHPSRQKIKIYEVTLDKPLQPLHRQMISDRGVLLDDGPSKFELARQDEGNDRRWIITMHEGRNRQIRRTFATLGYEVTTLHRTHFGPYSLDNLTVGDYRPAKRTT